MSDIGAEAVAAVYSALSDAQVQLRYAGSDTDLAGTITTVIGTGIEETRQPTDEGMYNLESATARYASADEPDAWGTNRAIMGQPVEMLLHGDTDWDEARKLRVANRKVFAGGVRLDLIAEFEEQ